MAKKRRKRRLKAVLTTSRPLSLVAVGLTPEVPASNRSEGAAEFRSPAGSRATSR